MTAHASGSNHGHPLAQSVLDGGASAWRGFVWLTQLGFPRSYPLVQFPNAPLIVAFAAGLVAQRSDGALHADSQSIAYLGMAVWAYLELSAGVNTFRRALGLTYLVVIVARLATALHATHPGLR
jgi:hypothetical protein